MTTETLSRKALNRATLARQMLLAKEKITALRAIERLVGLQAQQAKPPFVGLWARIADFQRDELLKLLQNRKVIRATLMRCTLHLMSAKDYVAMRAALQPVLSSAMRGILRERADKLKFDSLLATARQFFTEKPGTFDSLRDVLLKLDPAADERAQGYAVRTHLPLVMVPAETAWGFPAQADFTLAETWLDQPLSPDDTPHALVQRYLAAFGPATAADVQTWSGLAGVQALLESLRPKLRVFRDERKRELFDVPKAPLPAEDTPAPVRFLPEFDNLVLAHSDRTRLMEDEHRPLIVTKNLQVAATFLIDGFVAGTWKATYAKKTATLVVTPFKSLSASAKKELSEEGEKLVQFIEPDAAKYEVRFEKAKGK